MEKPLQLQQKAAGESSTLCNANGIVYKAFRRSYGIGGAGVVLSLVASCYYDFMPGPPVFMPIGGDPNRYKLMQTFPAHFPMIVTYYTVAYCSHFPSGLEGDYVLIEDANGEHKIRVEDFG